MCTRVHNEKAATVLSLYSCCNAEAWDGSKTKLQSNIWDSETLQASRKNGKPLCPTLNKGCCYRNKKCFLFPSGQVTIQDSALWLLKSASPKERGPGHHPGHVLFFLEDFIHHWFRSARALHEGFFLYPQDWTNRNSSKEVRWRGIMHVLRVRAWQVQSCEKLRGK